MKPPKPPRVTEINVARGPHTPVPPADTRGTEPPPAPMPMEPPKHLAGPRGRLDSLRDDPTLIGLAPPSERRPAPVNPPPSESMRPPMPSVEAGTVTLAKGKWAMSMPNTVALALIACLGGALTAWISKPNAGDPAEIAKTIRNEMLLLRQDITNAQAAITHRQDGTDTKVDRLQDSQDRLRERFNERFAQEPATRADPLAAPMNRQLTK